MKHPDRRDPRRSGLMSRPAEKNEAGTERREAIQQPGDTAPETLGPGVALRPLIGAHNHAHQLFTGLMTIEPRSGIPYITRPCCAAVTLLEGEVDVEVEGRRYRLGPLDCITVPAGIARRTINDTDRRAVLHVALAMAAPTLEVVNQTFPESTEPEASPGRNGREKITRGRPESRFALAPHAMFQDYFNAELG